MPIVRTYACEQCNHMMDVVLSGEDWDAEPPSCPSCEARSMNQEFRPIAIGGSNTAKAHAVAEDILANDYHVADMQRDKHSLTPAVRYKDQTNTIPASTWQAANATLQQAISIGRETRLRHGNGLDVLQANLASGAEPDLIANSKRRAMKVW
jgi:putative FmdB family regulatory protein